MSAYETGRRDALNKVGYDWSSVPDNVGMMARGFGNGMAGSAKSLLGGAASVFNNPLKPRGTVGYNLMSSGSAQMDQGRNQMGLGFNGLRRGLPSSMPAGQAGPPAAAAGATPFRMR